MKIYLVRHGEAAASWRESDDPGLSTLGHQQAAATAQRLAEHVDSNICLISSPLQRARETAQPLSMKLDTEITIIDAFREIPTPVERAERQTWLNDIARQSWGEQHEMVQEWHRALLQQLTLIQQPTVVFTHFMVLNVIVGKLTAKDQVVCFLPDNASVTTLELNNGSLQLLELGQQLRTVVT